MLSFFMTKWKYICNSISWCSLTYAGGKKKKKKPVSPFDLKLPIGITKL